MFKNLPFHPHTLGLVGISYKENELRVPIYPEHLGKIPEELRKYVSVEKGYGERFGITDSYLSQFCTILSRHDLFKLSDIIVLPKVSPRDFSYFKEEQVLWGWCHCVQDRAIVDLAIRKRLTLVCWESMYKNKMHVFHKNNEIAGYSSIYHALQFIGITGQYGKSKKIVVIGFGSVGRGVVKALLSMGFTDITLLTQRSRNEIVDLPSVQHYRYEKSKEGQMVIESHPYLVLTLLGSCDIIVNCVLQNSENPQMFIPDEKSLNELKKGTLIVDVSCDFGMGFYFATPTTFNDPIFKVRDDVIYYSVDHSPAYFWNSASYEISEALLPYISEMILGNMEVCETLKNATEIYQGKIINDRINSFQERE